MNDQLDFDVHVELPWVYIRDFWHLAELGLTCVERDHDHSHAPWRLAELAEAMAETEKQIRHYTNEYSRRREEQGA